MELIGNLFLWFISLGIAGFICLFVMPAVYGFAIIAVMSPFMLIGWLWNKLTGE